MKRILGMSLLALLVLATALNASAQADHLNGKWNIEWLKPNGTSYIPPSTNPITLAVTNNIVSGVYVNDEKEICGVTGITSGAAIAFTVQCPSWKIDFAGTVTNDLTFGGTYTVPPGGKYVSGTHGYFTAEKSICFLPEGCPNNIVY